MLDNLQLLNSHCKAESESSPTAKQIFITTGSCEDLQLCVHGFISLCQQCLSIKCIIPSFACSGHCSVMQIQIVMRVSIFTQRYLFTISKVLQKPGLPAPNLHKGGVCILEEFTDRFTTSALPLLGRVAMPHQYQYTSKHNTKKSKLSALKYT